MAIPTDFANNPVASRGLEKALLYPRSVLGEIWKVDAVVCEYQEAPMLQGRRRILSSSAHRQGRQVIEKFRNHDDVVTLTWQVGWNREPDGTRAGRAGPDGFGDQSSSARRGLGCIEAERSRGYRRTVRPISRGKFENTPPRARSHRMKDRLPLEGFVRIVESSPRIAVGVELGRKARESNWTHQKATNVSAGRAKAAICVGDIANPNGSSTIRPVCVR
ncbi:hypothetical protein [Sphingomonas nostoxanthinifaciens]|uniref:hypothetical protein n=1 Tax=Sphingomonas nostoxanthinifaciens TaxID=2872652 RepID=UPI001CC20FE1|nr:hypothetical protein [Sphingomonas nostoxanthinifaciens]UAK23836.1 hypothetical protein K8P63_15875 [Sphingomonas nostoxanthinifaciens]